MNAIENMMKFQLVNSDKGSVIGTQMPIHKAQFDTQVSFVIVPIKIGIIKPES